jgi:hypothetical protein
MLDSNRSRCSFATCGLMRRRRGGGRGEGRDLSGEEEVVGNIQDEIVKSKIGEGKVDSMVEGTDSLFNISLDESWEHIVDPDAL